MSRKAMLTALVIWACVLGAVTVAHAGRIAPASGTTDCALSQSAGANHIAVDWPTGQQNPTNTFAGAAPAEDLFGVLSCGDGRHVELQWLAGSPKASFTWGDDYAGSISKR